MRLIIILAVALAGILWLNYGEVRDFISHRLNPPATIEADPETYSVLIGEIDYHRNKLASKYLAATSDEERSLILQSSANFLELVMPAMMNCWLSTPWDYNGTSTTPGDGKIACGYFVSVIMRDAGFDIQRIMLAQQPSQNILLTFLPKSDLEIKTGIDYSTYMQSIRKKQDGIYIIGLDKHVGFVVKNGEHLKFIHSGGKQQQVVNELEKDASSIRKSHYRVIGNLTENKELLRKWLFDESLETHI